MLYGVASDMAVFEVDTLQAAIAKRLQRETAVRHRSGTSQLIRDDLR
jgi:hypothetical protein